MNRLKLLVASCVVALISGCSFSVKHRGDDGCGEPGVYTSHHTCQKCGKKSRRFGRTTPLYPGDTYGQWGDQSGCGCGEQFAPSFPMEAGASFVAPPFMDMSSGCSTCGSGAGVPGTISGGCGAQGGAIDPSYLAPQQSPPAPALRSQTAPAPVPPANDQVPMPERSPIDPLPEGGQPMDNPAANPIEAPKPDEFGVEPNGAPPAETPADPVSWQIPQIR